MITIQPTPNGNGAHVEKKIPPAPTMPVYPVSIAEMRNRYLKLYTGAVNDVLRFKYSMHTTSRKSPARLPASLDDEWEEF